MSDIYLQITETPTVVTLSAPVVSGALASTVTVANTVTVALDSNSLSALENVTVTVGAAITGTVTVSNFPASQAVTFSAVTISNFPATQPVSIASVTVGNTVTIAGTVTANNSTLTNVLQYDGSHYFLKVGGVATTGGTSFPVYVAGTVTANPTGTQTITGTVTAMAGTNFSDEIYQGILAYANDEGGDGSVPLQVNIGTLPAISGTVTVGNSVTIGSLPALVAGTAQIGSVTASISGTVPISISSVTVGNTVTIAGTVTANPTGTQTIAGTVTAMAGTNFSQEIYQGILTYSNGEGGDGTSPLQVNIGSLPAISGTVTANTFAVQGTAVTTSNFTSTTASTVLANYNATREVLTIFNEGAGNLHICAGATCTTIAYQVRLSAGDYYEVPNHQTTITHSGVFATAGTARVTQVS